MASGQTQGPQGPYPVYQPAYQPPRKPLSDYLKVLLSDLVLAALLWVGLLLLWLGSLWAGASDTADDDGAYGIKSFGMLLATWALIIGGVLRHDLEKWVRLAMIAAGALLIIAVGFWPVPLISFDIPMYG
ncbi:MAG: hypothetical protein JW880_08465 [Candidatus Thermoplasmatota archaeon]|nr:hypothetical protein [Candidatus Thermoplasmatota archaeon]